MSSTRIYLVTNTKTNEKILVDASNKSSALAAVVNNQYTVENISARGTAIEMSNGTELLCVGPSLGDE